MIAKLERTQSNAQQNIDKDRTPTTNVKRTKQHANNNRTTALEWTAAQVTGGGGVGGGVGDLAHFTPTKSLP